MIIRGNFILS